jgi:hypothetical protein
MQYRAVQMSGLQKLVWMRMKLTAALRSWRSGINDFSQVQTSGREDDVPSICGIESLLSCLLRETGNGWTHKDSPVLAGAIVCCSGECVRFGLVGSVLK